MWLQQLLLALTCGAALISARPLPLPQPDASPELERREQEYDFAKYFHEPGYSVVGAHYDSRYFHGEDTYESRRETQAHMLRAYFTFFAEKRMETWIAHGTLLGWWWNGKMLPWDWDIDTQVSEATLLYMGKHHNGTMYDYTSVDDPKVKRTYLVDVSPAIVERERGNGNNVIDARFIDTSNGLYIDITGLSETRPEEQPGVWSCKNYHRYHTTDLYPMRETVFEGVTAKVPYAYDRLLTQEYNQKALVLTEYEGHRWNSDVKEWMQKSDEEIRVEKEELQKKKQKQKLEKQRIKEQKEKKKEEATKQEQEKQRLTQLEEENKKMAAELEAARKQGSNEQGNPQQVDRPKEDNESENTPQADAPQPNAPAENKPEENKQQ